MNASRKLSRRAFVGGLALLGFGGGAARAQGFAGLGENAEGFAAVVPGRTFAFPGDHGPHPEFRIEWWYVTANLRDASGAAYGAQWTLFRQATRPGAQAQGWANQQIWMGHAAVTSADTHRHGEAFARGGVGQAGVDTKPFLAWIDAWEMRGGNPMREAMLAPLDLKASGADFSYTLRLDADRPLVLQGNAGYSGNRNADRRRIITASRFSRRAAASASATSPSRSPALPGWTANGAASRLARTRPDGTGSRCT